jgi:hypothetical protein
MQIIAPLFGLIVACLLQLTLQIAALIEAVEGGYNAVEDLPLHFSGSRASAALRRLRLHFFT